MFAAAVAFLTPAGEKNNEFAVRSRTNGTQGTVKAAQIKDGKYDTSLASDPGVVPGPNVIRIAGFDGKVIPLYGQGKQIFNAYELRDTVAAGAATKDFVVPASAADNLRIYPTADQ
jgi:hypothetical protein